MEDIWKDENEPEVSFSEIVYAVSVPQLRIGARIAVDSYDLISSIDSWGFAKLAEVYEWLVEWELAYWKAIGPEDSELFATNKLKTHKVVANDDD